MFSRNGQYIINQLQEDTFDKQLPSSSVKVNFKQQKQKIFNRIQRKYELELLKQQIHQKCKAQQLEYLDQLEKERLKYYQIKEQENRRKKQYLLSFAKKKYQIGQEKNDLKTTRSKTQQITKKQQLRDSIDEIKIENDKQKDKQQKKRKLEFSLEPNQQKKVQAIKQDEWVKRVRMGRKILEAKFGKYRAQIPKKKDTDSDSSSNQQ